MSLTEIRSRITYGVRSSLVAGVERVAGGNLYRPAKPLSDELGGVRPEDVSSRRGGLSTFSDTVHNVAHHGDIIEIGAAGDLAKKKIVPDLLNMIHRGLLAPDSRIFLVDQLTQDKFAGFTPEEAQALRASGTYEREANERIRQRFAAHSPHAEANDAVWQQFLKMMEYVSTSEEAGYRNLSQKLQDRDTRPALIKLDVPPSAAPVILKQMLKHGILNSDEVGVRAFLRRQARRLTGRSGMLPARPRVEMEKPFGVDAWSAHKLGFRLFRLRHAADFFLVDHYLGKTSIRALEQLQVEGALAPILNSQWATGLRVFVHEDVDVKGRGKFYEEVQGAPKDMIQPHLLQALGKVLMSSPKSGSARDVGEASTHALCQLYVPKGDLKDSVVLAQYTGGVSPSGEATPGYLEDAQVESSKVPTYAAMILRSKDPRWSGLEIMVDAGKAMGVKRSGIILEYAHGLPEEFARAHGVDPKAPARLEIGLEPAHFTLFSEGKVVELGLPEGMSGWDAYERTLLLGLEGDRSAFVTPAEVIHSWRIVDKVIRSMDKIPLSTYERGGAGPQEAESLAGSVPLTVTWS
jgi:glucose-6-phosphate 1-dehydrogenase